MNSGPAADRALSIVWAKTNRAEPDALEFHPLVCHSLDTLAVTECWLRDRASPRLVRLLAAGLGWGEDLVDAALPFFVGVHDLGKAMPAFQVVWEKARAPLAAVGLDLPTVRPLDAPSHGAGTAASLPGYLARRFGWAHDGPASSLLAQAVGSHHGQPVLTHPRTIRDRHPGMGGCPAWPPVRVALLDVLRASAGLAELPEAAPDDRGLVLLAGTVSVLDWVASLETVFGYRYASADAALAAPALDPNEYLAERARPRAKEALDRAGFSARRRGDRAARGFGELFPGLRPRAGQRVADEMLAGADDQFLLIVEDAMGAGKTEVAFAAIERAAAFGSRGSYLALPTRATSDQAYRRLRAFLEVTYPDDLLHLHLLHGTASFDADYLSARRSAYGVDPAAFGEVYDDDQARPSGVVAGEWFARSKRGLLGDHAVGTVDQAMLGALRVRHHWVRLWGLADKLVVLDEVHAYDTYMTGVIRQMLEWLGALGASVVLLSATLPARRRAELLTAFSRGAGMPEPEFADARTAYPRLTLVDVRGCRTRTVPTTSRRRLVVEWLPDHHSSLVDTLATALAAGACVALVCNTVTRARALHEVLSDRFPGSADDGRPLVDMLTSRFRIVDRRAIEARVLTRFGAPGQGTRPRGAILVATQVIEQSLDLDFDLMISEVAPVDLLLQRAGRVHRHERPTRPSTLSPPRLAVLAPEGLGTNAPIFDPGTARVYDEHALVRTLAILGPADRCLDLPDDIDALVQGAYAEDARPPAVLREAWERTRAARELREEVERAAASTAALASPSAPARLFETTREAGLPDDEEQVELGAAPTRLGQGGFLVVVLHPSEQKLALGSKPEPRALLERSLQLPPWAAPALGSPPAWRSSPLLRRARLALLDADGRVTDERGTAWRYTARTGWSRGLPGPARGGSGSVRGGK